MAVYRDRWGVGVGVDGEEPVGRRPGAGECRLLGVWEDPRLGQQVDL